MVPFNRDIEHFELTILFQDLAWTGWKNSGKGVTLSKFGFDQFVKLKNYHLKDYPK